MTNDDALATRPLDREALTARVIELHDRNYNCAQAVACTLAPLIGADEDACFRAAEALGGGMGGFTETCGALSGTALIFGLMNSNGSDDPTSKPSTYRIVRRFVGAFRERNGSTLCPELKGIATRQPLRSCTGCMTDAVELAIDALERQRA